MSTCSNIIKEIDDRIAKIKTKNLENAVEERMVQAYQDIKGIVNKNYASTTFQDKLKEMFPKEQLDCSLCGGGTIIIRFRYCESVEDGFLVGVSGEGRSVEDACENLFNNILGKTLRFTHDDGTKTEIKIIRP